jgi:hypothetical protein
MMDHSYCAGSSKSPPLPTDGGDLDADVSALLNVNEEVKTRKNPCCCRARVAVDVCLAAACLAGAALLAWWALLFQHPSYAQLWMVPVGLVLGCTPVVVCVALHFSPAADHTPKPAPLSTVVVVKS